MEHFTSYDGTVLAYQAAGAGPPLVCLPGGPGLTPEYLGDLGGLAESRELIFPHTRGTGGSAVPVEQGSYRCDRLVGDVEALRAHLGLARMDLLGHSAAANLATLYAAAYPQRLDHLILLTPGVLALGLEIGPCQAAQMEQRSSEPWYPAARAAVLATDAGEDTMEIRRAYAPFFYGRWDDAARAHAAIEFEQRVPAVEAGYYAAGAFDPPATRAELPRVSCPVLVYEGDLDVDPTPELAAEVASLFPKGQLLLHPSAGHFPWVDDPAWFTAAITSFLR